MTTYRTSTSASAASDASPGQMTQPLRIERLAPEQHGLLQRFYRAQRSSMRVKDASQAWVARDPALCAGLCLRQVGDGHWLTGLLVHAERRRRGIAGHLLAAVRSAVSGPLWLFCAPELADFYRARGFLDCHDLPEALRGRLARYRREKPLLALYSPESARC